MYAGVGRRGGYSFYLRNSTKAGPGDPSFRGSTPRSRSVSVAAPLHSCHEDGSSSNPPPRSRNSLGRQATGMHRALPVQPKRRSQGGGRWWGGGLLQWARGLPAKIESIANLKPISVKFRLKCTDFIPIRTVLPHKKTAWFFSTSL